MARRKYLSSIDNNVICVSHIQVDKNSSGIKFLCGPLKSFILNLQNLTFFFTTSFDLLRSIRFLLSSLREDDQRRAALENTTWHILEIILRGRI